MRLVKTSGWLHKKLLWFFSVPKCPTMIYEENVACIAQRKAGYIKGY
jgi:hypothetical protein